MGERKAATVTELFLANAAHPHRAALRSKRNGKWEVATWGEWIARSRAVAKVLAARGVAKGDRVAIFATTREEWVVVDMAILLLGAVTVPVYPSLVSDQAAYVIEHSGAKALFVEDGKALERLSSSEEGRRTLAAIPLVVAFESGEAAEVKGADGAKGAAKDGALPFREVLAEGKGAERDPDLDARIRGVTADDLATLVYTSGTTGHPKGVMLTHGNIVFELEAVLGSVDIGVNDEQLLFLPLAHIFARMLVFATIRAGAATYFAESLLKTLDNAMEVNPTFMGAVPRLYEKIHQTASEKVASASPTRQKLFAWAVKVGRDVVRLQLAEKPVPLALRLQHRLADKLVLSKIRGRFGTRFRYAITGGAPLAREVMEWFLGAGVHLYEAYGLTETTGGLTVNEPKNFRLGTVGRPLRGVEVAVAEDGEILARGPNIMRGYFRRDDDTREVIDGEGWFRTGDIGELDVDGYLRITDRKKDLIITAGGKNIAPQNIENLLKQSSWVSQAMVYGDRKPYLVGLVTVNPDALTRFAETRGKKNDGGLSADPELRALVKAEVDRVNAKLSSFETLKKFAILPGDFSVDGGELTPTLKVKRKVVTERHKALLESLYSESAE